VPHFRDAVQLVIVYFIIQAPTSLMKAIKKR